jgi:hypothetical protein
MKHLAQPVGQSTTTAVRQADHLRRDGDRHPRRERGQVGDTGALETHDDLVGVALHARDMALLGDGWREVARHLPTLLAVRLTVLEQHRRHHLSRHPQHELGVESCLSRLAHEHRSSLRIPGHAPDAVLPLVHGPCRRRIDACRTKPRRHERVRSCPLNDALTRLAPGTRGGVV